MVTATASGSPGTMLGSDSRYARVWRWAGLLTGAVWVAVALLQSPRLPLLVMAAGLGAVGGVVFVRVPGSAAARLRQYAVGGLEVAGLVLVTVGIGHHLGAGLATVALLGGSSPPLLRWVAGDPRRR